MYYKYTYTGIYVSVKVLKAMIFALNCLGKTIIQTKLKVLTDYAENNNEIILNRNIKIIFKKAI